MHTADGRWEGLGAELLQDVVQQLNVPFEFREFSSLENLIGALEDQEIDVFPSLPVGEQFESILDFSQSYLKSGLSIIPFEGILDGLEAVASRKIDAFVLNEQVLKYQVKKNFPGRVQVLPGIYDEYFVSIALPPDSPLRKPINKALLNLMKTKNWTELLNRYIQ